MCEILRRIKGNDSYPIGSNWNENLATILKIGTDEGCCSSGIFVVLSEMCYLITPTCKQLFSLNRDFIVLVKILYARAI